MPRNPVEYALGAVTNHSLLVVVLVLVLSAGMAAGVTKLQLDSEASGGDDVDSEVAQKQEYVEAHYGNASRGDANASPAAVYVRDPDGNVLSRSSLLSSLRYRREVAENASVRAALGDDGRVVGVAGLVARRAAGDPDAGLDAQVRALEAASDAEVRALVRRTLSPGSPALGLVPADYEPGTASATSRRMVFEFRSGPEGSGAAATRSRAQRALYDAAAGRDDPEYFTLGEHAVRQAGRQINRDTLELVVPVSLAVILAVLAFAYRDLVDVVVGFAGVVLSVLWMFGVLGWLEVAAGATLVIGPVLVVGLSVDYGLHVFMRYRERRGPDEGVRAPMRRSLAAVGVALALVTATTAVGFLANLASGFPGIRSLAVGITLGVVSAFVVFVTFVPALKVTVDRLLERLGLDRRKRPLGKSGSLRRLLSGGVAAARVAAPAVVVLALVAGAAGAAAWPALDRQAFQQQTDEVAEWKQSLPEPLAMHDVAFREHRAFVGSRYRRADESDRRTSQLLVEGDVTAPGTLERVREAERAAARREAVFARGGTAPVVSPLSVLSSVAERNESVAAVVRAADTDGNGVPDRNLERVYDALYAAAPEAAARVVERTDGEYRSLRVVVPVDGSATLPAQAETMRGLADVVEDDGGTLSATAVGAGTVVEAEAARTARSILATLLVALGAVLVVLTLVYRLAAGSASLGAVTVVPIALVMALVVGGMYLLSVPLTLVTALLMSLVVGLGIDYNIHVSDRFARELHRGRGVVGALTEAVTGTGGALLGSTLTSTGAFSALLLHPHPQIQSFGTLVVLGLTLSFAVSVFVLPSLLLLWARYVRAEPADAGGAAVSGD